MHRALGIRIVAVGVVVAGLWIAPTQQREPADLEIVRVTDDLHVLVGSGGNVGVYITDDGVVLIDSKFDRNVPQIIEKVKSLTDQPIRYVLNTHHHGDHTGGNQQLMAGAEVVAHENARKLMVQKNQPGLPRITFRDKLELHFGGKEVHAYYFGRGHTNGDAVIYFPALKTVHTGDLKFETAPFIDYSSGASGLTWPKTLDKVAASLDYETVIPGHGPVTDRAGLAKWNESFKAVVAEVTRLKKQGKSKEEVAAALDLEKLGWQPSQFFGARSLPGLYDEIP